MSLYPDMPSASRASLPSSGTASGMSFRGAQAPRDPSADASGRQQEGMQKKFLVQPQVYWLCVFGIDY